MEDYSLLSIVKILHKWRKLIVYGTAAAAVLSIVVALLIPVYYEATTTFYAASEDLFKPKKAFGYGDSDVEFYGTTADIQRVLTVARSSEVTDFLVEEFDLYEHYNIDSSKSRAEYYVREEFLSHYNAIRTKYDAIVLTIEDRDPVVAAAMANSARGKVESILSSIIKSSQGAVIESYHKTIDDKLKILRTIQDSLQVAQMKYGIFDPEAQTEYLSTLVTSTETKLIGERAKLDSYNDSGRNRSTRDSLSANIAGLERMLDLMQGRDSTITSNYNIERFSGAKGLIEVLNDEYEKARNNVNFDKELLKTLESANNMQVPAIHLLEAASVPVVKSRPKRSLLVIGSTLIAFIFLTIGVLFLESYRHLDWSFLRKW